ncbi:Uncharacterised protein [Mycobacteroides abscessus subsp. abscessus]|nr:Uncharacterised protein [Mycobacteroides abscessus subsp. abscessus]
MWQCQLRCHSDVGLTDGLGATPRRVGDRSARHHQIGTHSVHVKGSAQGRYAP